MTIRYVTYGIIVFMISILMWYYIAMFCGIYLSSSYGWIKSSAISLAIDWLGVAITIPFLMAVMRSIVKSCNSLK